VGRISGSSRLGAPFDSPGGVGVASRAVAAAPFLRGAALRAAVFFFVAVAAFLLAGTVRAEAGVAFRAPAVFEAFALLLAVAFVALVAVVFLLAALFVAVVFWLAAAFEAPAFLRGAVFFFGVREEGARSSLME
jgi:hypothetical protein